MRLIATVINSHTVLGRAADPECLDLPDESPADEGHGGASHSPDHEMVSPILLT